MIVNNIAEKKIENREHCPPSDDVRPTNNVDGIKPRGRVSPRCLAFARESIKVFFKTLSKC